jgi:gamma-tubulin complex component 2
MFANYTASLSRYLVAADADLANAAAAKAGKTSSSTAYDPAKFDKLADILQKYEDNFSRHLKVLLDTLNYLAATETVVFLSLCARLSTANEGTKGSGSFG